jgi:hypothetical protein
MREPEMQCTGQLHQPEVQGDDGEMKISDLLLTATLQMKTSMDQVVPLLELTARSESKYNEVYTCYKTIQCELSKAAELLKAM